LASGEIAHWILQGSTKSAAYTDVLRARKGDKRWKLSIKEEWGMIKGAWRVGNDRWIVAQARGIGMYSRRAEELMKDDEVEVQYGCMKVVVSGDERTVSAITDVGSTIIYDVHNGKFNRITEIAPPESISDHCIVDVVVMIDSDAGVGKLIVSSRPTVHPHGPGCVEGHNYGTELSLAEFSIASGDINGLKWEENGPYLRVPYI
jgi:hypothetical protein